MQARRWSWWVPIFLGVACASTAVRPGVGDISFRLTWSGVVDLDLYVLSPLKERVDFIFRSVESGGQLDVDCNVHPDPSVEVDRSTWVCPEPMENIFWPTAAAPRGVYKYWIVVANPEGMEPSDEYRLEVRFGRQVVRSESGPVSDLMEDRPPSEVELTVGQGRP